ncbi:MAG: phosphatidylglycerophosphatase A [Planctomycetaceae bacterium]|nr:phosphatidylglycerophosphatase A [Planctomycetaceae bacterium]
MPSDKDSDSEESVHPDQRKEHDCSEASDVGDVQSRHDCWSKKKPVDEFVLFAAEGFGLGRLRPAPGTWGSLWGMVIGYVFGLLNIGVAGRLVTAAVMFAVGVPLCGRAAELRGKKDPGSIVWDEMAAFPIVYVWVPLSGPQMWSGLVGGFLLFRLFDIWKPPVIRQCDRVTGGFGIMLDDAAAGLYATATLWLVFRCLVTT